VTAKLELGQRKLLLLVMTTMCIPSTLAPFRSKASGGMGGRRRLLLFTVYLMM
jgi:hypothetical protein